MLKSHNSSLVKMDNSQNEEDINTERKLNGTLQQEAIFEDNMKELNKILEGEETKNPLEKQDSNNSFFGAPKHGTTKDDVGSRYLSNEEIPEEVKFDSKRPSELNIVEEEETFQQRPQSP